MIDGAACDAYSHNQQIGLVGTGVVGGELFKQFEETKAKLLKDDKVDLVVAAVSGLKDGKSWMYTDPKGLTPTSFEAQTKDPKAGSECDFGAMADFCKTVAPNVCMVDCTAAEAVSEAYLPWLEKGCHVATPNKKVGSGPLDRYKACKAAMEKTGAQWGYETTVGAGLPIIGTTPTLILLSLTLPSLSNTHPPTPTHKPKKKNCLTLIPPPSHPPPVSRFPQDGPPFLLRVVLVLLIS